MKKNTLFFLMTLLVVSFGFINNCFSQDNKSQMELTRSELQTMKQDIVAQVMNLTEGESAKFWPLYKEFQYAKSKLTDESIKLIEDYAKSYESLSDDQALNLVKRFQTLQSQKLTLENKYMKKFSKELPGKLVAKYFQAENKLDAITQYDLSGSIPMVK